MPTDNITPALNALLFDQQPDYKPASINPDGALYFGTGLRSFKNGLTCGLPFEYFSMFCVAAGLAVRYGYKKILQEITDSYIDGANDNSAANLLQEQSGCLDELILNLCPNFDFSYFSASSLRARPGYQAIRAQLLDNADTSTSYPPYAISQSAGLEFLRAKENVTLKLGWAVDINGAPGGYDERFFNEIYRDISGQKDFSFIYMKRAVDAGGNRTSPYFCNSPGNRLMINGGTEQQWDWLSSLPSSKQKAERNYYNSIGQTIALFEALVECGAFSPPNMNEYPFTSTTKDKALFIVERIFQVSPQPPAPLGVLRFPRASSCQPQ